VSFRNEAEPAHVSAVLQELKRLGPTDVPDAGSRLVMHPQTTDGAVGRAAQALHRVRTR